jgi:hypothetical protein
MTRWLGHQACRPHDYEMHNNIVVYEADRCIAWELGNPESPRSGSRWRFDLTPEGPNVTVVTETYDCTDFPESVRGPSTTAMLGSLA